MGPALVNLILAVLVVAVVGTLVNLWIARERRARDEEDEVKAMRQRLRNSERRAELKREMAAKRAQAEMAQPKTRQATSSYASPSPGSSEATSVDCAMLATQARNDSHGPATQDDLRGGGGAFDGGGASGDWSSSPCSSSDSSSSSSSSDSGSSCSSND